jgi:chromate transporter
VLWLIAAAAFAAIFVLHAPFPAIIAVAAVIGYGGGRWAPNYFSLGGGHGDNKASYGPALIDDATPTPAHAVFRWSRFGKIAVAGLLLWAVPMLSLSLHYGTQHTLTQMGWFFTKAALLTFGGAYAVLPYVYQGAVEHYGWLNATQMIDGLALGETTPGPLIMVVAFVGFIGGYVKALFGPDHLLLAGAVAATLVTWFTFLPSFIFILLGGPLVETTHNDLKFTSPLTAITAAVVGVIVNLALFFGYHVLWPQGFAGAFDAISALLAVGAALALFRYKQNVLVVIGINAIAGLIFKILVQ